MDRFTDLLVAQRADGIFDLVLDEVNRDCALTQGMESALIVSLFSDRRAREDEVADPMKRRGWTGDLVAEVPGDVHGSGLWLYAQRRAFGEEAGGGRAATQAGLRSEAQQSLEWLVADRLVTSVAAEVVTDPAARADRLTITLAERQGGPTSSAFLLAAATRARALATL
jgi:phage gp46-like protein